jgi:hypothetical protein
MPQLSKIKSQPCLEVLADKQGFLRRSTFSRMQNRLDKTIVLLKLFVNKLIELSDAEPKDPATKDQGIASSTCPMGVGSLPQHIFCLCCSKSLEHG